MYKSVSVRLCACLHVQEMDWRETRYCSRDSVFFLGVAAQRFASPSPPGPIYSKTEERHEGKYARKRALKMLKALIIRLQ